MESVQPGQRFVTKQNFASEWVVDSIVRDPVPFPHVRIRRASDQTTQKLLALSVLTDQRSFRPVDWQDGRG